MESWKEQLKSKIHESELSVSEISDKTKIKNIYKKTFIVLIEKLFSTFEKVSKKQQINVKIGK